MFYAIDFDTRLPESKSDDGDLLASYVIENGLELAVAVVDSPEDLAEQLTIMELNDLYNNLNDGKEVIHNTMEQASEAAWEKLGEATIPKFTKALGKKLLTGATKAKPDTPSKIMKKTKEPAAKKPTGAKTKDLLDLIFTQGPKVPRKGTSFQIFVDFLDENLDEASFDELVQAFIENYVPKNPNKPVDESLGKAYVRDAFNGGYIEEIL